MTIKAEKEAKQRLAQEQLRNLLPPGSTVKTILRHVSRSGMMRAISPVIDGEDYSWLVARAGVAKFNQTHGGLTMGGCGMDMGFSLVYSLSRTLYPDAFDCIGESCPANDHSNRPYPERVAGSMRHSDGGYALKQAWL